MSTVASLCPLTVSAHAQRQALLQAAVLATVTVSPVDQTVPLAGTRIHGIVLLTAAEEALNKQKHSHLLAHLWYFFFFFLSGVWSEHQIHEGFSSSPCSLRR